MAAYSLEERFPPPQKPIPFFEPGKFFFEEPSPKPNKVPFLSKVPRKTLNAFPIWTDTIYNTVLPQKIPNATAFLSKKPRFPYEAFTEEDLQEILCKCGIQSSCECPVSENEPAEEFKCQGKVIRRLFKGPVPSNDPDAQERRLGRKKIEDDGPKFYDARVNEFTKFYQGCKWSKWTSKRKQINYDDGPGPAQYSIDKKQLTEEQICMERVRAHKRKTCRQLRFIEMVQRQNMLENRPGPTDYHPTTPRGTELQFTGPKGERFTTTSAIHPGPADHFIRRDFEPPPRPDKFTNAKLPERACFGMKSRRFIPRKEEGPSPASYSTQYKACQFIHCPTAPFSSSAPRFKPDVIKESDDENQTANSNSTEATSCPRPMWQFRSKTVRLKPLVKKYNEPSPADLPQPFYKVTKSRESQRVAPFLSSDGRFQPWYSYLPVYGVIDKSQEEFLNLEKPRSPPAFTRGPMFRSKRFAEPTFVTPAPNEYDVKGGIETVLNTFNTKLINNMENLQKNVWHPPPEPPQLNYEQKYALLLQKSISLLEPGETLNISGAAKSNKVTIAKENTVQTGEKKKLLRFFLYSHQIPRPT